MARDLVCILGGSGFIGGHLAAVLAARGVAVRIPTRSQAKARNLLVLPGVDVPVLDVRDPRALAQAMRDASVVVNLIAILHGDAARFARVHADLASAVATAARTAGVDHLVHMSALGVAPDAPSEYLRSKAEGERRVAAAGIPYCTFRPSVVFGHDDRFTNTFAQLLRLAPLFPLACPDAQFQPVWVEDLARALADAVERPAESGKVFQVCGPNRYTLRELVATIGRISGAVRPIVGLPDGLARLQAHLMEFVPGTPLSRDNLLSMRVPSVCDCDFAGQFGFAPSALEAVAPEWLAPQAICSRFSTIRTRAGR